MRVTDDQNDTVTMIYYNLKDKEQRTGFREAALRGLSAGMGLFMPERIARPGDLFFRRLPGMTLTEVAVEIGSLYIGADIPRERLITICEKAFDFPVVIREIDERREVLELFHGPTAAFKDFGARFMAGCMGYFADRDQRRMVILVATSGDTGGAIASSFLGTEGVDVIILYPSGKVSTLQESQLTTLGQNITAIEVEGTFDECQAMARSVLAAPPPQLKVRLTSANSINIARLIPQTFYYYWGLARAGREVVLSVPSGNMGNITAAAMAWRSGLPMSHLVAATNVNKTIPQYLKTGEYTPKPSVATIANAMDVGAPGNFERFCRVFDNDYDLITRSVSGYWYDDREIGEHIASVYRERGYLLDPHGAVASLGLDAYLESHPGRRGLFVATAHPAKFTGTVEPLTGATVEMPPSLAGVTPEGKKSLLMKPEAASLADYLRERYDGEI